MRVWALGIFCCSLVIAGCGTDSAPAEPTARLAISTTQTTPLLFNNGQGVPVGAPGLVGFGLMNGGTGALIVETVTYAGDPAITGSPRSALPATLAFNEELVVDLTCVPPGISTYAGVVTLASNAVNLPQAEVFVSCTGTP
jgi:hypothetical protein